jgi:hypothetical protein
LIPERAGGITAGSREAPGIKGLWQETALKKKQQQSDGYIGLEFYASGKRAY